MTNRIRDKTIAPPLVPGSRKTGRLLFSDMLNAEDDSVFVLLPLSMKALLEENGENCLALLVADWTLIPAGAKAAASWPKMIVAIAQTHRVNIDLAMLKKILVAMQDIVIYWLLFSLDRTPFFNMEVNDSSSRQ